jgi:imidazoleglycerol phosphate dehydratase HisB
MDSITIIISTLANDVGISWEIFADGDEPVDRAIVREDEAIAFNRALDDALRAALKRFDHSITVNVVADDDDLYCEALSSLARHVI